MYVGTKLPEQYLEMKVYNVYLRKEMMVERVEYCWLIFSEGVVQGGGFMGIPGGNRPHR